MELCRDIDSLFVETIYKGLTTGILLHLLAATETHFPSEKYPRSTNDFLFFKVRSTRLGNIMIVFYATAAGFIMVPREIVGRRMFF